MKRSFSALIIIAAIISGCAGTSKPAAEPIIIDSKDMNIQLLDRKIENLKDTMTLSFASMDEYYIQRTTKLHAKLDRIEAENDEMEMQSEKLAAMVQELNAHLQKLDDLPLFYGSPEIIAERTVETIDELIDKVPEEDIIKPEKIAPDVETEIKKDPFITNYKDGLNKFYYQRYGDAVEIFEALLRDDPQHHLAENVKYWIGESYYALRQYKKAYNAFNEVFQTNAFDKYDDTQLKLGFCYFKMGKMRSAIQEFQNLITYYPNSEHVTIAIRQIGIIEQYSQ